MLIILLQCCLSFIVVCCASVIYNQRYQPYRDTNVQQYQDYYYQDFPHQTHDYGSITTTPLEEFSHDIDDVTDLNNKFPGFLNEAEDKHAEYNKFLLKHRKNKFKKRFKKRRRYCKPPHKFRRFRKPSRADFVIYDNINNVKLIPVNVDSENDHPKYKETLTYPSRTYDFSDSDVYYGNSNRRHWNPDKDQSFASKDKNLPDSYPSTTVKSRTQSFTQLRRQKRKNFNRSHSHKVQIPENIENSRLAHDDSNINVTSNVKASLKSQRDKNIKGKVSVNKHKVKYNNSFAVHSKPWRHTALNILNSFNAESGNEKSRNQSRNQLSLQNPLNGHMKVISDENNINVGNRTKNYSKKLIPNKIFSSALNEDDFYPIVGYRVKKQSLPYSSNSPAEPPIKNRFYPKENVVIVTPIATLDVSPSRSQETKGENSTTLTEVIANQQTGRISSNDENESSRQSQLRRLKSLQFNKNDMSLMNSLPVFSDSDSNILSKGWRPMIFSEEQQDQETSTDNDFSDSSLTTTHSDRGVILEGTETSRHDRLMFDPEDTTSARSITIADRDPKTEEDYTKLFKKIQPYILKKSWINKLSDDLSTVVSSHIVVQ